jgi:hypothetical protein
VKTTSSGGASNSFASWASMKPKSRQLASSEADLGQARYLLGSGCPQRLALQILS